MSFDDLVDYMKSHYSFQIDQLDYSNHQTQIKLLGDFRMFLKDFEETVIVRISGDDIFYQIVQI